MADAKRLKVLVAEDDRSTQVLLTRTLERWGYEVVAAADGEDAWARMKDESVRLLITDWEMPRLDGPALCERIRTRGEGSYVYILLLTSHRSAVNIVQGLDAGADDFVTKPFDAAELRARLSVGRRILALQDELAEKNRFLERANAQLARIASTDPLMGIGNRRSFEAAMNEIHTRARHDGASYSVVMCDIDHFKRINDRYGHSVGDRVLTECASTLGKAMGERGKLFRYGGEEIVLVFDAQPRDEMRLLGERLRAAVAGMKIVTDGGEVVSVTSSFGAALYDGIEDIPWPMVVQRADASLYASKWAGRNCVTFSLPPPIAASAGA